MCLHVLCLQAELAAERLQNEEWERQRLADARAGLILETQEARQKKQLLQNLKEDNKTLAKDQNAE